jgi:membrane protein DedA with SNARE-associated domain
MDVLLAQTATIAGQNPLLAYLLAFFGTIFFGNVGAFLSFWAAFQGGFGVWGVPSIILTAFAAGITGDCLWYAMGRGLHATRLGNWIKKRFPNHGRFSERIERKGPRWMLFAKFAYGSNFPIIFSLGWARFPFHRLFRRSLLAIVIWLPIILGLSYGLYSSLSPIAGAAEIKHFETLFLLGLILFIILQFVFSKVIERFFSKNDRTEESPLA